MALSSWSLSFRTVVSVFYPAISFPTELVKSLLLRTPSSQSLAPAIAMVTASCCLAPAWGLGTKKEWPRDVHTGLLCTPGGLGVGVGAEKAPLGIVGRPLYSLREEPGSLNCLLLHTGIQGYKDKAPLPRQLGILHTCIHACILSHWYALPFSNLTPF